MHGLDSGSHLSETLIEQLRHSLHVKCRRRLGLLGLLLLLLLSILDLSNVGAAGLLMPLADGS